MTTVAIDTTHLRALHAWCTERKATCVGSDKFKRTLAAPALRIQCKLAHDGMETLGPKRLAQQGTAFFFGGRTSSGKIIDAASVIDYTIKRIESFSPEEVEALEAMAETIIKHGLIVR